MNTRAHVIAYLQLVRLPASFSAWSNILAAHWIATQAAPDWPTLGLQLAITTALYWSGMVLNDCFDRSEDRLERPNRPIPSGLVPVSVAWSLGWTLMALALGLAALAGGPMFPITALLAGAILLYDAVLKGTALGPWAMGLCRYLNWLLGLAVLPLGAAGFLLPIPIFLYTAALTYLSGRETQGMDPRTLWIARLLLAAAALTILVLLYLKILVQPIVIAALILGLYGLILGLRPLASASPPAAVQSAVRWLLFGMIPLDALLLLGSGQEVLALALLGLLIPARMLGQRLYVT